MSNRRLLNRVRDFSRGEEEGKRGRGEEGKRSTGIVVFVVPLSITENDQRDFYCIDLSEGNWSYQI